MVTSYMMVIFHSALLLSLESWALAYRVPLLQALHPSPSATHKPNYLSENATAPASSPSVKCPWCQGQSNTPLNNSNRKIDEGVGWEEIRQIRLELVKAKILSKLDLTEAPKGVVKNNQFPSLMTEGIVPWASFGKYPSVPSEERPMPYIFLVDSKLPCPSKIRSPSSCFRFTLMEKDLLKLAEERHAILWMWKMPDKGDGMPQMITISQFWRAGKDTEEREMLLSYHVTNKTEGWIPMNIPWSENLYTRISETELFLRISCHTCTGRRHNHPISTSITHRPFLVLGEKKSTNDNQIKSRRKRSYGECSTNNQRCCRDSLYVNFTEFGWNNWILHPTGFTMYYCRGSCSHVTADSADSAGTTYSGILQRLMLRPNLSQGLRRALAPCCSAGHKEDLSILWTQNNGSSAVRLSVLEDMIVTTCDCFG